MNNETKKLIDNLIKLPAETEWVEFKANYQEPQIIGEYISALSNSACLHQKNEAYLIFGIEDKTFEIIGTSFNPRKMKGKGNEDLEPWLTRNLSPKIEFKIEEFFYESFKLVVFFIEPAKFGPVQFLQEKYIRIGSAKQNLKNYPEKEALIWDRRISFEAKIAQNDVNENEILNKLDFDKYFQLTNRNIPNDREGIISDLVQENFLQRKSGRLHITNLGAIVLARKLNDFPKLENKRIRVITYKGNNKLQAIKDRFFESGYAVEFESLVTYIESQIPSTEQINSALRRTSKNYPTESIRTCLESLTI